MTTHDPVMADLDRHMKEIADFHDAQDKTLQQLYSDPEFFDTFWADVNGTPDVQRIHKLLTAGEELTAGMFLKSMFVNYCAEVERARG